MKLTINKELHTKIIGYEWVTDDLNFDDQIEGDAINVIFELTEYTCGELTNSEKIKILFFGNKEVYRTEIMDMDNRCIFWGDEDDELYFARSFFDPKNEHENNPEIMIDYLYEEATEYLSKINVPTVLKECHSCFGETIECDYIRDILFDGKTRKVLGASNISIDTNNKQVTITDKENISKYTFRCDYNFEADRLEEIINCHTVIANIRYIKKVVERITEEPCMGISKHEALEQLDRLEQIYTGGIETILNNN